MKKKLFLLSIAVASSSILFSSCATTSDPLTACEGYRYCCQAGPYAMKSMDNNFRCCKGDRWVFGNKCKMANKRCYKNAHKMSACTI